MTFTDAVRELTSRRVRPVSRPHDTPTPFQIYGGFGPASDPAGTLPVDPATDERNARAEGARQVAHLEAERLTRAAEVRGSQLRGVARGYDFSRGLNFRDGRS